MGREIGLDEGYLLMVVLFREVKREGCGGGVKRDRNIAAYHTAHMQRTRVYRVERHGHA